MKIINIQFLLLSICFFSSEISSKAQGIAEYQFVKQQKKSVLPKREQILPSLIGEPFPNMTLITINKEKHTINQFHERVLLLHFWATWCPPCRKEFESLQQLQSSFDKDQFVVAAVSHDVSVLDITDFLKNKEIDITIYFDSRTRIINQVYPDNNGLLPISILVDKEGKIVDLIIGVQQWSSQAMINKIKNLVIK